MALDKHGFTIKEPISDDELIYICLNNAPCGTDRKHVIELLKVYTAIRNRPTGPYHLYPQPKPWQP